MMKYWTLFCLLALGFTAPVLQGCKKDAEPDTAPSGDPPIVQTTISGAIELPSGSPRNVNTLSILSPVAAGTVATGRYQVNTIQNEFTTQIAADASGQPVLMGYCYPGQTDFAINAQSTVLAMLMNTGVVYSLTPAGKQQLIPRIKADPGFAAAVQEVERLLRTPSTALLDTTNNALGNRVAALFTNVSRRVTGALDNAVLVNRAGRGREVTFTNSGVPFYNTVGIYKNGQRIHEVTIDGANFFAGTPTEVLTGLASLAGGPSASPSTATYTLPGDGQFDIRIRTGKPGAAASGPEQRTALVYNLAQGALLVLQGILPQYKGKGDCTTAVAQSLVAAAFNLRGIVTATDATSMSVAVGKFSKATYDNSLTILQNCGNAKQNKASGTLFAQVAGYLLKFLDVQVRRVGCAMNVTALTAGWMLYPAAQDTCFVAAGSTVGPCIPRLEYTAGNNQTGPASQALPTPLKVRVLNSQGNPEAGVRVTFTPAGSNGSAAPASALSDANGYAQTTWTLGSAAGTQALNATASQANGQPLANSPVGFTASLAPPPTCVTPAQLQLLTNGSSKTWRMVESTYFFANGSPPIRYTGSVRHVFNVNGQLSYDAFLYGNGRIVVESPTRTLPDSFCPYVPVANGIKLLDRDRIITTLTATRLEARLGSPGGNYEMYYFDAP